MPSPLLFFIFIVAIDLILKSSKKKKKAEEARRRTSTDVGQMGPKPRPVRDLRSILEEELNKQKEIEQEKRFKVEAPKPVIREKRIDRTIDLGLQFKDTGFNKPIEVSKPIDQKSKSYNLDFKKNLLNGVIISEILAPPKSMQNKKRSL